MKYNKYNEYTLMNPRYLLWMLISNKNRIPEGNQTNYMLWIQNKIFEFKNLTKSSKITDYNDFDEWLIYTVRNELTSIDNNI